MDALRTELREYLWDGEYRDKLDAQVTSNGKPYRTYSVFISPKSGKRAVVIVNYENKEVKVQPWLDSGRELSRYRLVDNPTWKPVTQDIQIPAQSALVVIE